MHSTLGANFDYASAALTTGAIAELALALALPAVAVAFGQRWCMADIRRWRWVGPLVVMTVVLTGALGASALPSDVKTFLCRRLGAEPAWWPTAVCLAGLALGAAAAMLVSVAWWDRYYVAGRREGFRAAAVMSPIAGVCAGLAWLVLFARSKSPTAWVPSQSVTLPLAAMLMLVGLNAGGLARAFANRGLDRWASLAVCVVPTLVIGGTQYALLTLMWGIDWSAAHALIAAEPGERLDSVQLLGRVAIAHALIATVLAIGGWVGIRVAPRPRIHRPHRDHFVFTPPAAEPVSTELPQRERDVVAPIDASI
jgi:hypothetical protein